MGIVAIVELLATVVPQLVKAGGDAWSIWNQANSIVNDARSTGHVDEAAYERLVQKCGEALAALDSRAQEARDGA